MSEVAAVHNTGLAEAGDALRRIHLPRVIGLYGIPGAPRDPDEWSSLFIAVALCGGLWSLVREPTK